MKYKKIQKVIIALLIILLIIMSSTYSVAQIKPSDISGETTVSLDTDFTEKIMELIRVVGIFIAVGAMMIIGIKYVAGSLEEKATYKKSMMPYLIGCFILFGASLIAPQMKDLFENMGTETEEVGNLAIGIIQTIGTIVTVAVLMILGIKYMLGSLEERATYKKSMTPYLIGVILIFAAANLTGMIYNFATNANVEYSYSSGTDKGRDYILSGKNATEVYYECETAKKRLQELQEKDPESKEIEYLKGYIDKLNNHLREMEK